MRPDTEEGPAWRVLPVCGRTIYDGAVYILEFSTKALEMVLGGLRKCLQVPVLLLLLLLLRGLMHVCYPVLICQSGCASPGLPASLIKALGLRQLLAAWAPPLALDAGDGGTGGRIASQEKARQQGPYEFLDESTVNFARLCAHFSLFVFV